MIKRVGTVEELEWALSHFEPETPITGFCAGEYGQIYVCKLPTGEVVLDIENGLGIEDQGKGE